MIPEADRFRSSDSAADRRACPLDSWTRGERDWDSMYSGITMEEKFDGSR